MGKEEVTVTVVIEIKSQNKTWFIIDTRYQTKPCHLFSKFYQTLLFLDKKLFQQDLKPIKRSKKRHTESIRQCHRQESKLLEIVL